MPTRLKFLTSDDIGRFHAEQAASFPDARYGARRDLPGGLVAVFDGALATRSEEAMQQLLTSHPYLLQYAFRTTGHHGIWAYPKRWIRTQRSSITPGLIPDFIAAMRNSLGYSWQIIELKRPDVQFANVKGDGLSTEGHKALAQCGEYATHFAEYIENVRVNIGEDRIRQPDTVTIVMGDSRNETEAQRRVRANFQELAPKISIVTYDRLRRGLVNDIGPRELVEQIHPDAQIAPFLGHDVVGG